MTNGIDESGQESGSALRQKLEETLEVNKGLTAEFAKVVTSGLRYVKPEDLNGVSYDQIVSKAQELEAQRAAEREQILADALKERGLEGNDLEAALAKLKGAEQSSGTQEQKPATAPFASTGTLQGGVPPLIPADGVFGADRIRLAVGQRKS